MVPTSGVELWPVALLAVGALVLAVQLARRGGKEARTQDASVGAFGRLRGELARAAEAGGSLHIALGNGGVVGDDAAVSVGGVRIAAAVADMAIAYGLSPTVSVGDPTLLPLAEDALRRAYEGQGATALYCPGQVRYVAPWPAAFAAGAGEIVESEDTAVTVVAGSYGVEVALVTDPGARRGLPQFVALVSPDAIGASYPVTERLAVGEALFSAAAHLSRDWHWAAGLAAQDVLRVLVVAAIVAAGLWALVGG